MMSRSIKQVPIKDAPFLHRLIYKDGKGGGLLHCPRHDLRGKPDAIFKSLLTGRLVPIELKSAEIKDAPHHGDIMQLTAYFLIIHSALGKRPKKGYLRYKNAMFKIKNTARRRKELASILADMRKMLTTGKGEANPSFIHCRYCAANGTVCEFIAT